MIKLSEAIKTWLSEWHLCEMCEHYHYKQLVCKTCASEEPNND